MSIKEKVMSFMETPIDLSRYPTLIGNTIMFSDKNGYYYYELNNKLVSKTNRFDKKTISILKKHGFFGQISKNITTQHKRRSSSLMLLLSKNCPMACRYCYAKAGESDDNMSPEIAEKAVSAYLSLSPKDPWITLFGGGEPTSNKKTIIHIVQKYKDRAKFKLTTSGVMPPSFLEWLIEHGVSITFSIDGPPEIQNFLRPLKNGKQSSSIVENSLKIWKTKSKRPLSVRTTLVEESVNNIGSILNYFDSLGVDSLHLEPLANIGRALNSSNKSVLIQPNVDNWIKATLQALDWAKDRHKRIRVGELNFLLDPKMYHYCGPICGNTIVVTHKGSLTACVEVFDENAEEWLLFNVGKLQTKYLWNNKLRNLRRRTTNYMSVCLNCYLKYICRGGCAHRGFLTTGSISFPDPRHCEFMMKIVPILIMRMAMRVKKSGYDR